MQCRCRIGKLRVLCNVVTEKKETLYFAVASAFGASTIDSMKVGPAPSAVFRQYDWLPANKEPKFADGKRLWSNELLHLPKGVPEHLWLTLDMFFLILFSTVELDVLEDAMGEVLDVLASSIFTARDGVPSRSARSLVWCYMRSHRRGFSNATDAAPTFSDGGTLFRTLRDTFAGLVGPNNRELFVVAADAESPAPRRQSLGSPPPVASAAKKPKSSGPSAASSAASPRSGQALEAPLRRLIESRVATLRLADARQVDRLVKLEEQNVLLQRSPLWPVLTGAVPCVQLQLPPGALSPATAPASSLSAGPLPGVVPCGELTAVPATMTSSAAAAAVGAESAAAAVAAAAAAAAEAKLFNVADTHGDADRAAAVAFQQHTGVSLPSTTGTAADVDQLFAPAQRAPPQVTAPRVVPLGSHVVAEEQTLLDTVRSLVNKECGQCRSEGIRSAMEVSLKKVGISGYVEVKCSKGHVGYYPLSSKMPGRNNALRANFMAYAAAEMTVRTPGELDRFLELYGITDAHDFIAEMRKREMGAFGTAVKVVYDQDSQYRIDVFNSSDGEHWVLTDTCYNRPQRQTGSSAHAATSFIGKNDAILFVQTTHKSAVRKGKRAGKEGVEVGDEQFVQLEAIGSREGIEKLLPQLGRLDKVVTDGGSGMAKVFREMILKAFPNASLQIDLWHKSGRMQRLLRQLEKKKEFAELKSVNIAKVRSICMATKNSLRPDCRMYGGFRRIATLSLCNW
jgi:hypothetical protein